MTTKLRYIGLDVHKESIVIAVAEAGHGESRVFKSIHHDLPRLVKAMLPLGSFVELPF